MEQEIKRLYFQSKGHPELRFLSNFYLAPFDMVGKRYATVEHFYQSAKTLNTEQAERIRLAGSPSEARELGNACEKQPEWEFIRLSVMELGLQLKFDQNPELRRLLIATEGYELVEYAPWGDTFWGVDKDLRGENNLGKLLTKLRTKYAGG